MSRIFTYGCSFQSITIPTWADILIKDSIRDITVDYSWKWQPTDCKSIWETNTRTKFNSNDIVIIMWTNFFRDDRYLQKDGWHIR